MTTRDFQRLDAMLGYSKISKRPCAVKVSKQLKLQLDAEARLQCRPTAVLLETILTNYLKRRKLPAVDPTINVAIEPPSLAADGFFHKNLYFTAGFKKLIKDKAEKEGKTVSIFLTDLINKYEKRKTLKLAHAPPKEADLRKSHLIHFRWKDKNTVEKFIQLCIRHQRCMTNMIELLVYFHVQSRKPKS